MPTTRDDIHRNVVIVWKPIVRCIASPKTYPIPLKKQSGHGILNKIGITYSQICPDVVRGAVQEAQELSEWLFCLAFLELRFNL